jgi:hypothetical protein
MHAMKIYGESRSIAPLILNLNTRCNRVVSVMTWLLYSWGKNTWYLLNMRLCGAPEFVMMFWNKRTISCFWQEYSPQLSGPQPIHYTDWCPSSLLLWVPYLAAVGIRLYHYLYTNCQPSFFFRKYILCDHQNVQSFSLKTYKSEK